jgi:hypothetical protein
MTQRREQLGLHNYQYRSVWTGCMLAAPENLEKESDDQAWLAKKK